MLGELWTARACGFKNQQLYCFVCLAVLLVLVDPKAGIRLLCP